MTLLTHDNIRPHVQVPDSLTPFFRSVGVLKANRNWSSISKTLFCDQPLLNWAEQDPSLSNFTFRRTQHASCGYQAWLTVLKIPLTMLLNTETRAWASTSESSRLLTSACCGGQCARAFANLDAPPSTQTTPGAVISRGKSNC